MTAAYLAYQIESGADAVQLFESNADLLSAAEYREFSHPYQVRIFQRLAAGYRRFCSPGSSLIWN